MPLGVYEIWIHGCASTEEALALQEPIARLLCPDELHSGPCEVPWGFSLTGDDVPVLVLGIYATDERAASVVDEVHSLTSGTRQAELHDGDPAEWPALVTQYRIEHGQEA